MQVKRQKLVNFRSHASTTLNYGPGLNIFSGPQGVGKTSMVYALALTLIGRTPNTAKDGKGMARHIRDGQAKAEISADCVFNSNSSVTTIGRTISESGQTIEAPWGKGVSGRQTLILDRMGVADEAAECLLDTRLFADRTPDEQKAILLKLLREPVIEVPPQARAVGISSLSGIQQVDDQIKSLKDGNIRALNAVIKSLEESLPEEVTAEQHADALETIREASQLEGKSREADRATQDARYRLEEAQRLLTEIEQAASQSHDITGLRAKQEDARKQVKHFSDEVARVRQELEGFQVFLGRAEEGHRRAQQNLESVDKLADHCSACQQTITAEHRAAMKKLFSDDHRDFTKHVTELRGKIDSKRKELNDANEQGRQERMVHDVLASHISDAERAAAIAAKPKPDISEFDSKLKACETASENIGASLVSSRGKADVCRDTLRRKEERDSTLAKLEQNRTNRESYRAAVESLEQLKSKILSSAGAKQLELEAQSFLEKILPSEKLNLSASGSSMAGIPVSHLSNGEKVIFDVCLRVAAARNTGFGLLALDNASNLPVSTRTKLLNALVGCGCQVILCTTQDKIQFPSGVVAYQFSSPGMKGPTSIAKI